MPTARVDTILYIADRNDSRKITLLMNTCCDFFSWPKSLMEFKRVLLCEFKLVKKALIKD